MKATHRKKGMQGLLLAFIVVGGIVLWKNGPDRVVVEARANTKFSAENPLYFYVGFGDEGTASMLGAVDESGGPGTGYNVAFVDENNNGDLTDEPAKPFRRIERGSRAGRLDPRFEFDGPFKPEATARYTLNIYSLTRENGGSTGENDYYFFWYLNTDQWRYFFINGRMRLSASMAEAREASPVRLGGPCQWDIQSNRRNGKAQVSAGLKDENGCTLRYVRQSNRMQSPSLSLIKDGKVVTEEAMEFG